MRIAIPAAAVKSQLKQLLIDLMNNESLLRSDLTGPDARRTQAGTVSGAFELQPYYFYAVDELPVWRTT